MISELGLFNGKRLVWDDKSQSIVWSVPAEREAVRAGAGRKLVISDFSQIEVRLIAFLAQETSLINALNSKRDIHCHMASLVYGHPYELVLEAYSEKAHKLHDELSAARAGVKTVTFGIPYGAGAKKVAEMIQGRDKAGNIIESFESAMARAKELIDGYFKVAPNVKVWLEEQKLMAHTKGYTTTVNGRKRFYNIPDKNNPDYEKIMSQIGRWSGNQPVQGTSADVLKDAMRRLYKLHRGDQWIAEKIADVNLLLVCHDEIVTDSADKDLELAKEMLTIAMRESYNAVEMTKLLPNGTKKTFYLKDIYNKVDVIVDDFWAKG